MKRHTAAFRRIVAVTSAVVVAAAVMVLLVELRRDDDAARHAAPIPANHDGVVAEFSGKSSSLTDPFVVRDGWEIHWQARGKSLEATVTGDADLGMVVDQHGEGVGSTYVVGSGTFRLQIVAQGTWTVSIVNSAGLDVASEHG